MDDISVIIFYGRRARVWESAFIKSWSGPVGQPQSRSGNRFDRSKAKLKVESTMGAQMYSRALWTASSTFG
jgi:hypothetical protein